MWYIIRVLVGDAADGRSNFLRYYTLYRKRNKPRFLMKNKNDEADHDQEEVDPANKVSDILSSIFKL